LHGGIHLALLALGIGPGDEVIVPDVTWIASAAPITYVGATPVFADVDERTWCLSADSFSSCITGSTKAVIPVDLYGGMPEMDSILEIARGRGITVIEDAAEAIGSEYRGRKAGSFGTASVFSFQRLQDPDDRRRRHARHRRMPHCSIEPRSSGTMDGVRGQLLPQ